MPKSKTRPASKKKSAKPRKAPTPADTPTAPDAIQADGGPVIYIFPYNYLAHSHGYLDDISRNIYATMLYPGKESLRSSVMTTLRIDAADSIQWMMGQVNGDSEPHVKNVLDKRAAHLWELIASPDSDLSQQLSMGDISMAELAGTIAGCVFITRLAYEELRLADPQLPPRDWITFADEAAGQLESDLKGADVAKLYTWYRDVAHLWAANVTHPLLIPQLKPMDPEYHAHLSVFAIMAETFRKRAERVGILNSSAYRLGIAEGNGLKVLVKVPDGSFNKKISLDNECIKFLKEWVPTSTAPTSTPPAPPATRDDLNHQTETIMKLLDDRLIGFKSPPPKNTLRVTDAIDKYMVRFGKTHDERSAVESLIRRRFKACTRAIPVSEFNSFLKDPRVIEMEEQKNKEGDNEGKGVRPSSLVDENTRKIANAPRSSLASITREISSKRP